MTPYDLWLDRLDATLAGYDEVLIRQLAARLLKSRGHWPVEDLRDRLRTAVQNAPVVDRRLKDLSPACRKILALIGLSRQPCWKVTHLLSMLAALGHAEGLVPIQTLFEEGLLYPIRKQNGKSLVSFRQWLASGNTESWQVFAPPQLTQRALGEDLGLPELPAVAQARSEVREADGLEWPLRLAVVWQQVAETPLRQTLQGDFFKRDLQRLQSDALLNAPFADSPGGVPDTGLLGVAWAKAIGLIVEEGAELRAGSFSAAWNDGLFPLLRELWSALPTIESWDPIYGWQVEREAPQPFPSVYLLLLLLLGRQAEARWVRMEDVEAWLLDHHPFWDGDKNGAGTEWFVALMLGLFYQLRLIQFGTAKAGDALIRLSSFGRWLLESSESLPSQPEFRQTLMVQANFEILAFRQGLTPGILAQLARFARWKSLGTACLLELHAEQVYRGLESGLHLEDMRRLLQQHGMRELPENVSEALRTWSNKRDRIVVYDQAALLEFASPADLDAAMARGLVEQRLSDRIALVRHENAVDFRQFRLTSTRDYGAKAEQCLQLDDDGVTFSVDRSRSDLLLELEIARVAESAGAPTENQYVYRFTHDSLQRALANGLTLQGLEEWFQQRSGRPLSPAARLLALSQQQAAFALRRCLVLTAPSVELADGLMQFPDTRRLIQERLGPFALLVAEEDVAALRQQIELLRQTMEGPD
ncbi:MAG TPA: hypothetical protein VGZ47_11210 [Gemmataceae bacterium]|nr:hypothetical protein [Gemmataceae bacterium]